MSEIIKLYKKLTRNDTGETKSHQSGITIPASVVRSGIFPILGTDELNPRITLLFYDEEGQKWEFQYIYYNDFYFGKPAKQAHNEHRLTCVRAFIREHGIKSGDSIWFSIDSNGVRHVGFEPQNLVEEKNNTFIKLGVGWHYIKI